MPILPSARCIMLQLLPVLLSSAWVSYAQNKKVLDFCGPAAEKYKVIHHRKHPTPQPAPGKSVIYFLLKGGTATVVKMSIALNGQWVALLPRHSYSYVEVDPGVQRICLNWMGGNEYLFLSTEIGKSYFIDSSFKLKQLPEGDGKVQLTQCHYVTMERKR